MKCILRCTDHKSVSSLYDVLVNSLNPTASSDRCNYFLQCARLIVWILDTDRLSRQFHGLRVEAHCHVVLFFSVGLFLKQQFQNPCWVMHPPSARASHVPRLLFTQTAHIASLAFLNFSLPRSSPSKFPLWVLSACHSWDSCQSFVFSDSQFLLTLGCPPGMAACLFLFLSRCFWLRLPPSSSHSTTPYLHSSVYV